METKKVKNKLVLKKKFRVLLTKIMVTIIIFLIGLIAIKKYPNIKNYIIENIYEKSFNLTKTRELYNKYIGNVVPLEKIIVEEKPVFNEKLTYKHHKIYKDGVELTVENNYLVPALEDGVVIFIGEKSDYGTTMIIEQTNGITVFYSNINIIDINLYDYIEKGELIGESKDGKLYLVFKKEGKYLDYKDYI